ncbi:hypothetical protein EPA93_38835 [Ktedonosporobacter rubrisoli]|uniref:Uncharacterized protein n=1 Tax=Ktedonosporobacter rubrisoli TaxID=2509675 RepID=A0A4P6K1A1_KTERU|nr:hypothetical protein [Ktedonosporobacter rubrisoli]QBD81613.1 hypothetical protein EPA93_38835 [Ktedonosporobacter rubrisoli]
MSALNEKIATAQAPTIPEILMVIRELNQAHQAYALTLPAELRLQIARQFHTHYLWLLRQRVNFGFDRAQQGYFLYLPAIKQEDNL